MYCCSGIANIFRALFTKSHITFTLASSGIHVHICIYIHIYHIQQVLLIVSGIYFPKDHRREAYSSCLEINPPLPPSAECAYKSIETVCIISTTACLQHHLSIIQLTVLGLIPIDGNSLWDLFQILYPSQTPSSLPATNSKPPHSPKADSVPWTVLSLSLSSVVQYPTNSCASSKIADNHLQYLLLRSSAAALTSTYSPPNLFDRIEPTPIWAKWSFPCKNSIPFYIKNLQQASLTVFLSTRPPLTFGVNIKRQTSGRAAGNWRAAPWRVPLPPCPDTKFRNRRMARIAWLRWPGCQIQNASTCTCIARGARAGCFQSFPCACRDGLEVDGWRKHFSTGVSCWGFSLGIELDASPQGLTLGHFDSRPGRMWVRWIGCVG